MAATKKKQRPAVSVAKAAAAGHELRSGRFVYVKSGDLAKIAKDIKTSGKTIQTATISKDGRKISANAISVLAELGLSKRQK